jgi:hypothetical protein
MCSKCANHNRIHGSPKFKRPSFKEEYHRARRVIDRDDWYDLRGSFNSKLTFFLGGQTSSLKEILNLYYVELSDSKGKPIMDFETALSQVIAVSLYLDEGGSYDHKRNQHQYFFGYAVCSPLFDRRRAINTDGHIREHIKCLRRMPKMFHKAYQEIVEDQEFIKMAALTINHYRKELKG